MCRVCRVFKGPLGYCSGIKYHRDLKKLVNT